MTYVALAPLTNLASVLSARPDLQDRLEQVIFVGGRSSGRRFLFGHCPYEFHDANVVKDPQALACVLETKIPLALVPIELSVDVLLNREQIRRSAKSLKDGWRLRRETWLWSWLWVRGVGLAGGPVFDSVAVLAASHPERLSWRRVKVRMDGGELVMGGEEGRSVDCAWEVKEGTPEFLVALMRGEVL